MSGPSDIPPRRADAPPAQEVLAELEAVLADQLARAQKDDLQAVLAACDQVEQLLRRAEEMPEPFPPSCADRLERIRLLYRRLGLTLAQRKQELAGRLEQLRGGKKLLRAYGGNP